MAEGGSRLSRRQGLLRVAAGVGGLAGAALAATALVECGQRQGGPALQPTATPRREMAAASPPTATTAAAPTATPRREVAATPQPTATTATAAAPITPARQEPLTDPLSRQLPRWRGFNLLEKLNYDWPQKRFVERDFAWIAEWGFNFVRLPMDYRCWTEPGNWTRLRQEVLSEIDEAVRFGERYGIHVCLNFHRAPGYTVAQPPEPKSLWTDEEMQRACAWQWAYFARRYKGIPSRQLSFNLFNEPDRLDPEVHRAVVARVLAAIRAEDGQRFVICDGREWGNVPPTELADYGVGAATRGYQPPRLTHYRAGWVQGADRWQQPTYPLRDGNVLWDKEMLRQRHILPWKGLEARGVGVMVGEFGAYNQTPHAVALAWMRDCLALWQEAGWGWALWNLRGSFGVVDSDRPDVAYETWQGHRLDRAMLNLLRG